MANTYLSRTFSASNRKTMTFSFWCKPSRSTAGTAERMISTGSATSQFWIKFENDQLDIQSNYYALHLRTTKVFRDRSAWYHIVVEIDTTQATSSNRVKVYVNGVQETSFATEIYPSQNTDLIWNSALTNDIGRYGAGNQEYFDGSMSHIHLIDGTAYDATAFGQYDANGVWTIKTSPSVTYGTNGFFILKDGNSVTDQSGNSNNFTVGGGTLTKTEDNPSNVFATFNPLTLHGNSITLSNGNTKATTSAGAWRTTNSTIGVSSGKWYFECKAINTSESAYLILGIQSDNLINNANSYIGDTFYSYGYKFYSGQIIANENNGGGNNAWGNIVSNNQIVGVAVDLTNSKLYFSINGVWQNSGDPTSGVTGTGGFSIQSGETYFAGLGMGNNGANPTAELNFGNGYFGTTAVSSAGTNASGIGIFEYDVPTGYTALSTKGLNL